MKFDVPPVGVGGVGASRKKQARLDLMSQGAVMNSSVPTELCVSNIAKKLLSDIVESLAKLAIKFATFNQPNSHNQANDYADLKLKLGRCRWAWVEPVKPQKVVDEYDNSVEAQERCLAQRRCDEAFAYLKHILALHDKPVYV